MSAPSRAKVWWKDHRQATTVYLVGIHKVSPFTYTEMVFWRYEDFDKKPVGPGMASTASQAWQELQWWATHYEDKATALPYAEDRVEPEETMPSFYPDEGNPAEERAGL